MNNRFAAMMALVLLAFLAPAQAAADAGAELSRLNREVVRLINAGDYPPALKRAHEALALAETTYGAESKKTGTPLNNLALLHETMGQYAKAESLYVRALAIFDKAEDPDHPATATSLNNLAGLYDAMGQARKAEPLYIRALAIREKQLGPEHADTGASLNNLAELYKGLGQTARAEPLYLRALAISEKTNGPEHPTTGTLLNNLAVLYKTLGQYAKAEALYLRALAIKEKQLGPEHPATGISLNNLAGLYEAMGQYGRAEPLFVRALAIGEKHLGPEHPVMGIWLNNLAGLYDSMDQTARAEPLYLRALAISEKVEGPEHPATGRQLNNLAALYEAMGQSARAEPLIVRALAISEKANGPEHPTTGTLLNNLARLRQDAGRAAEAEALLLRAWRIVGNPELAWNTQGNLRGFYARTQPDLAIWYGKQAVNTLQSVRGQMKDMDRASRKSFLEKVGKTYEGLANLLLDAGRLAEAQQVLKMLKEEEYYDFIRRSADDDPRTSRIAWTGAEAPWAARAEALMKEGQALGAQMRDLENRVKQGEAGAAEKRAALEPKRQDLSRRQDAWFAALKTGLPQDAAKLAATERRARENALAQSRKALGKLGPDVALVQYLLAGDKLWIVRTSAKTSRSLSVAVDGKAFYRQLVDFRQALENPRADPRPLGKELHARLIAPIAAELKAEGIRTLMLSLEGATRYIPFSALHDGQNYLVEQYALVLHTAAAKDSLGRPNRPAWKLAALGTTQAHGGFSPLPGVKLELATLLGQQGLPGKSWLDAEFTAARLRGTLKERYPVLHIASHFKFTPGTEADSFLLLGDGGQLSLKDLREGDYPFAGLDLLTLSACETAMQGGREANGREVEGFGTLAQNKGAKSVLATLWQIADASTPELMRRIYLGRKDGKLTKAEALRQAQLALLRGATGGSSAEGSRGAKLKGAPEAKASFQPDPKAPYAHPYYWAPFILMGNW